MRADGSLQKIWDERLQSRPFYASVELTDNGLMFGAGTQLAPLRKGNSGACGLDLGRDGDRVLALLAVAYRRPVYFDILRHVEGASTEWQRGDKALANIRLAYARLPRFERREDAYPLFLAASLLKAGFSPQYLMRQSAFDATALDIEKYNPDEPRIPAGSGQKSGRWTDDAVTTDEQWVVDHHGSIQLAAEDSEDEKRREDEKELPEAERRALNVSPRKEDVEEGGGIPLQRPLIEDPIGIGAYAGESIPARSPAQRFTVQERQEINRIGQETGCHTCGTKIPGTASGNFVPDHQPPSSLNTSNSPQRLYPHCITCSGRQGSAILWRR